VSGDATPEAESVIPPQKRPPCKRCGETDWAIEIRTKSRPRWLLETIFAVPDVLIFQGESAGWPRRQYELWTCRKCGRTARVAC
jgi:hypothetical protein